MAAMAGLCAVVVSLGWASSAGAQDVNSAVVTSTTVPDNGGQTLVEAQPEPARFLTAESRRIVAVIGGLVMVALALTWLTVRYWRATKPVAAGADHAAVDDGWEPMATGEHAQVDLDVPAPSARPSVEARRKALGLSSPR